MNQYNEGRLAYREGEEYKFAKSEEWQRGWNAAAYKERNGCYPDEERDEGEEECD